MSIMDILEDYVIGPLDLIDELSAPLILRSFDIVKLRIPRADKGGEHNLDTVRAHLKAHGVDTAAGNFSATEMTFYVRRSQLTWCNWLLRSYADTNSPTGYNTSLQPTRTRWNQRTRTRKNRQ